LDDNLKPLPIGLKGELYIGGEGLSRGYLNKPDLTNKSFISNPFASEEDIKQNRNMLLYKTKDIVRRLTDGDIDFIGRNDFQVKIRGFRIELGEIEAFLSKYEQISQYIVTTYDNKDNNTKQIVLYYVPKISVTKDDLRSYLSKNLPDYMIPSYFIELDKMPLNSSGKIDRKGLPSPEKTDLSYDTYKAPFTDYEKIIADVWKDILQIKRIGITDDFFQIGGDSILSIQLSSRLRNKNIHCSVRDIFDCRTIEELAKFVSLDNKKIKIDAEQGLLEGEFDLLPVQKWFFEKNFKFQNHVNQSFLIYVPKLNILKLKNALKKLALHHDSLRITFPYISKGIYKQYYNQNIDIPEIKEADISEMNHEDIQKMLTEWQSRFDIEKGPLWQAGYLYGYKDKSARIFFAFHHLIIDAVSWRILAEDTKTIYEERELGEKTTSYRKWVENVKEYGIDNQKELDCWESPYSDFKIDAYTPNYQNIKIDDKTTKKLLHVANQAYNTNINDLLLSALSYAIKSITSSDISDITLEGHGREDIKDTINVSRTTGWFTTIFPVRLIVKSDLSKTIKHTKEKLRRIPSNGIGYGALNRSQLPQISFNYLGQFDKIKDFWNISDEESGTIVHPDNDDKNLITINGKCIGGELRFKVISRLLQQDAVKFSESFKSYLEEITRHCVEKVERKEQEYTPSDFHFVNISQNLLDKLTSKYEIEGIYPANSLQQGFIYHALRYPKDDAYLVQMLFDYNNELNVEVYKEAWKSAIQKFPTLRICFNWDEELIQIITKTCELNLIEIDISEKTAQEDDIKKIQLNDRTIPFDLTKPGLFRLTLIKKSYNHYTLLKTEHHSICDGWTFPIIINNVHKIYGELINNKHIDIEEEQTYFEAQKYFNLNRDKINRYWLKAVQNIENINDLTIFFKSKCDIDELTVIKKPQEEIIVLNNDLYQRLKSVSQIEGLTINVLLQFAWHKIIETYTGDKQTIVGTTVSGRDLPINGIEESAGLYINTLPLIINWGDYSVRELLKLIHSEITELNNNSFINLADLQKEGKRLFNSLFIFENYPIPKSNDNSGLSFSVKESIEKFNYPLSIVAHEFNQKFTIKIKYDSEYIEKERVQTLLNQIKKILADLPSNLDKPTSEICIISDNEYDILVNKWNETDSVYPKDETIQSLFEAKVNEKPSNIAAIFGEDRLTFKELNERANILAHNLRKIYKDKIGICMERSLEMIIGIIGILKAGAAYVPFDIFEPQEKLNYKISDCGLKIILTSSHLEKKLRDAVKDDIDIIVVDSYKNNDNSYILNPANINKPSDLAYIIYTSGSTGNPKGVMVTHRNVLNFGENLLKTFGIHSDYRILAMTTIAFDISVLELINSLTMGLSIVILPDSDIKIPNKIITTIKNHNISVLQITPSHLNLILDEENIEVLYRLKVILIGGEPLPQNLFKQIKPLFKDVNVINVYGPTETTIWSTYKKLNDSDLTIGKPLLNETIYILSDKNKPLPIGAIGEICIGGEGVSNGYYNNSQLNLEKFIDNPFKDGERLYKTGDIGRRLSNGDIVCIGRNDNQVKIGGFRIELGEIENKLLEHPDIKESVVTVKDSLDNKYLAGYYKSDKDISNKELVQFLSLKLPSYMIPNLFLRIENFPLTTTGKINRKALPKIDFKKDNN
ncbi:MAG: amino acid adenylation domain-containing protein, partial [Desulfobacterales bacterium]|nr:amino acid adenylation domain-containing protein [Desulfobacterales bacterium]